MRLCMHIFSHSDNYMQLRQQLDGTIEKQKTAEQQRETAELQVLEVCKFHHLKDINIFCQQLKEEITIKSQELDRENRRKSKLEKDLKAVQVYVANTIPGFSRQHYLNNDIILG